MIAEATKVCGGKHGCGRELPLPSFRVVGGRPFFYCVDCDKKRRAYYRSLRLPGELADYSRRWRADNPARQMFLCTRQSARRRKIKFELPYEWFAKKIDYGICELTGLPFQYDKRSLWRPSPDRIDSALWYSPDNTRMICWGLNAMKGPHEEATFMSFLTEAARALNEQTRTH